MESNSFSNQCMWVMLFSFSSSVLCDCAIVGFKAIISWRPLRRDGVLHLLFRWFQSFRPPSYPSGELACPRSKTKTGSFLPVGWSGYGPCQVRGSSPPPYVGVWGFPWMLGSCQLLLFRGWCLSIDGSPDGENVAALMKYWPVLPQFVLSVWLLLHVMRCALSIYLFLSLNIILFNFSYFLLYIYMLFVSHYLCNKPANTLFSEYSWFWNSWILWFVSSLNFWCGFRLQSMEKGKQNVTYSSVLCTEALQANNLNTQCDNPITAVNPTNGKQHESSSQPKTDTQSHEPAVTGKNKDKSQIDTKTLFARLANARESAQKQKQLTLVACLIGTSMDFPKIFAKLRIDWRFCKGEFRFSDLKLGWFEIIFSNPLDIKKIWENRPYHVSGQLLLIKHWYVGFNPLTESISKLDLWVRIHKLPSEYANPEAISTILEMNNFGTLIRIDPIHAKRKWMTFTRMCVNTDVQVTSGKKIMIPDEYMYENKYNVWFDDFPMGCGSCGELDHEFDECPDIKYTPPKLKITLTKPSSKNNPSISEGVWHTVGVKKGESSKSYPNPQAHKPYLAENSGITIVYESEESSEELINPASVLPSGCSDTAPPNVEATIQQGEPVVADLVHPEVVADQQAEFPKSSGHPLDVANSEVMQDPLVMVDPENGEEEVEEDSEPFEDELDPAEIYLMDPDAANIEDSLPTIEETTPFELSPLFQDSETPFSDAEFNALLRADQMFDPPNPGFSDSTFHSVHDSMLSSSSMIHHLGGLEMNKSTYTHSSSSKRKTNDGVEDTASSILMGIKKPRI